MKRHQFIPLSAAVMLLAGACSTTRHVPSGEMLLSKVKIHLDSSSRTLDEEELLTYLRQQPNHKMLWSMPLRLSIYNLSGKDTTKWYNRWLRKMGEPPVIYDSILTEAGARQIELALVNKGYLGADVGTRVLSDSSSKKAVVEYDVSSGLPHVVKHIRYEVSDSAIARIVLHDTARWGMQRGDLLDRNTLDVQRQMIATRLHNHGYYYFTKENVTFEADTTQGSHNVDLLMRIDTCQDGENACRQTLAAKKYVVRKVVCIADYQAGAGTDFYAMAAGDTVTYRDMTILYGQSRYLRPSVIYENNFIRPGHDYSEHDVDMTYKAFSRLEILKFINVRYELVGEVGGIGLLDAYILLTPAKSQSMGAELEGTNSEGDLGIAVALGYAHRNIGRGSETFTVKLRGAYESISGNLDGLIHDRYMEYSADLGLQFPKFKAPFLKESFKRRVNASTQLHLSMNYQERPEYTRIISTAGWSYKWSEASTRNRHTFTPLDINYVYLPESTVDFINQIAPDNPLLRYSYEDHFIMRLGYSFYHTNKRTDLPWQRSIQRNIYNVRVNAEIAGNLLFALSSIFAHRSNFHSEPYKIFGIHYSQYFKVDSDFSFTHRFDTRQSIAARVGLGRGVPCGTSGMLPCGEGVYGGGANGVRGWAVRTLGPGAFRSINSVSDFMDQCGDIRFIMSAEYRAKLFWIVEMGAFIDIGNIWTIRNYANQPDGVFRFNSFYRQLAAAYGLGVRLDFDYFLLRFDLGMKAHNPAAGTEPWPLLHPRWGRDRAFHFSIGYPF